MKENEFDNYIRELMADAEAPVSPAVWEGISAGLDKAARKRVVPMWLWSAAAASVAAAIAAVFVLRPTPEVAPAVPVALVEGTPGPAEETPAPAADIQENSIPDITTQVRRVSRSQAYVSLQEPVQNVTVQETPVTRPTLTLQAPAPQQVETEVIDPMAFNRLIFAAHKPTARGLTFGAQGSLQGNDRGESRVIDLRRAPALYPMETTIFENPEFSFTPPISVGLQVRYDFSPRWGIGTGINYTFMSRTFVGTYYRFDDLGNELEPITSDIDNQQHWIGVPLNLYFHFVNTGKLNVYAVAGAAMEKMLSNHFLIHDNMADYHYQKSLPHGFQSSATLGAGLEYRITPYLGIYVDPSLRYYFNNRQPRSIRTIQPLRFDLEAGIRFTL